MKRWISIPAGLSFMSVLLLSSGCTSLKSVTEEILHEEYPILEILQSDEGRASYYHNRFHKRKTASGERYNKYDLTAAHRSFPFGTIVRVRSLTTGSTIVVRINDRGPRIRSRIIDLSYEAARSLGMIRDGVVPVRLDVLSWGDT